MKKICFFISIILFTIRVVAQAEPVSYNNAIAKFTRFYNAGRPDSIFAMFSPELKNQLPLDKFQPTTLQLKAQLGNLVKTDFVRISDKLAVYKATFQNNIFLLNLALSSHDKLTGLLLSPYEANKSGSAAIDPSLSETPILIKTLSGSVSGSLLMPGEVKGKIPVVLIVADGGPTDRDGNNAKAGIAGNSYKLLAIELAKKGVASVRYDKRFVGQSVTVIKESQLHIEDYSDDAVSLINLLNDDARFSKVVIFGHGEGAMVSMIASRDQPVKGIISADATADPGEKIITNEMKSKPQLQIDEVRTILDSLKKGKTTDRVDPAIYWVARPSIQTFLMSWCRYNPVHVIKVMKVPVLIIQGSTDLQVLPDNADKLKKARSEATLAVIRDMNHIFKESPRDAEQNAATFTNPDLPVKPEMVTAIVDFVNKVR